MELHPVRRHKKSHQNTMQVEHLYETGCGSLRLKEAIHVSARHAVKIPAKKKGDVGKLARP